MEKKAGDGVGGAREESALNMFRQMDLKGQTQADTKLKSTHQNTINTARVHEEVSGLVRTFSSEYTSHIVFFSPVTNSIIASGVDGRVVIWST